MIDQDLCYISAIDAIAAFKSKTLSPVELMQAVITRAKEVNPTINAFAHTYFDTALEQAKTAEARYVAGKARALEGLPMSVKDETRVKGQRATNGSLITRDNVDTGTAPIIERALRAGAIIHGRSTAPEFSAAAVTHSKLWGVTRNPWNTAFTPGGSSGGAGAQLAAGATTLANGSDIGGSIRIPAGCSGVVGFKPPYGRVPGETPYNMDVYCHDGPMARTVADCALFENVIAGPHPKDIVTIRPKLRIPTDLKPIKDWKIAYSIDLGYAEVDDDVRNNTLATLNAFRDMGATVEEVDLGWTWGILSAAMGHLSHLMGNLLAEHLPRHRHEMTNYVRVFAEQGRASNVQDFLTATQVEGEMYAQFGPLLQKYNVFICPTNAVAAVKADHDPGVDKIEINGIAVDPMLGWCLTYPFNMLSRCPVLAVPSGNAKNNVPTGIQIVGKTFDDVSVFRAACALEKVKPWLDCAERRPKI